MGLKRQILLALERRKNDYPGLAASNVEQVLEQYSMSDDSSPLYQGSATSIGANGGAANGRSFFRIAMIEDIAVFNGTNQVQLTTPLPMGAVPLSAHINYDTAITTAGGATGASFGITGTLNQLAQVKAAAGTNKNTKNDSPLASTTESATAATPLLVSSTNDAGALTGTLTGTVRVRVIYRYSASIPNAA